MNATFSMIFFIARGAFRSLTFLIQNARVAHASHSIDTLTKAAAFFLTIHFPFIIFSLTFLILKCF